MLKNFWFAAWLLTVMALCVVAEQAPTEPSAPQPSAAVQKILDEATGLAQTKQPEEALKTADRALALARQGQDSVGVAQAQRARARALRHLGRIEEAAAAWQEAAAAWARAGDGPGQVEALVEAGLLLAAGKATEADPMLAQALALGQTESQRPLAAAQTLRAAGRAALKTRNSKLIPDGKPPVPLPETQKEASAIANLYAGILLTGKDATEATLRQWIERVDVVHLATHGYLHPVRPMSSGLLLTVPEEESETGDTNNDGALQAWEVFSQLRLKAELVVLSGCETGRGQNVQGEGLIGLTRALQYAGARSIVASQWKVDDQGTKTLMVAFHRNLRKGLAKDEALRQAMAVVHRSKPTAHPHDWAAFLLIGNPDNPNLGAQPGTLQRK